MGLLSGLIGAVLQVVHQVDVLIHNLHGALPPL
jgi:hypothetical protein